MISEEDNARDRLLFGSEDKFLETLWSMDLYLQNWAIAYFMCRQKSQNDPKKCTASHRTFALKNSKTILRYIKSTVSYTI